VGKNKLIIKRGFEVFAALNLRMPVLWGAMQVHIPEYYHPYYR
jgi:hypothetical protein